MNRILILTVLVIALFVAGAVPAASPDSPPLTPAQTIAKLRSQLRNARLDKADLQDQFDAANAVIGDQNDTITRLRSRDPLDVILARSPDGLWSAMVAIWQAFPNPDPGQLCGYGKDQNPGDGIGLTVTIFSFTRTSGC